MSEQIANRILVIDDESTHRILAKEYLEEAGYIVRLAEDAKRGMKLAINAKPDLVLVDLMMPGMDGFEICQQLKNSEPTAHIPVVLVTASREPDVIARGFDVGVDDFITKPVDWAFIADRVSLVLASSRQKRRDLAEKAEMARRLQTVQSGVSEMAGGILADGSNTGTMFDRMSAEPLPRSAFREEIESDPVAMREAVEENFGRFEQRLANQSAATQSEAAAAILGAKSEVEVAQRELAAALLAHADAIRVCRAECEAAIAEVRRELVSERERHAEQLAASRTQFESIRRTFREAQDGFASVRLEHEAQLTDLRLERDQDLDAMEAAAAEQLAEVQMAHASELAAVRAQNLALSTAVSAEGCPSSAVLPTEADDSVHAGIRSCWDVTQHSSSHHLEMVEVVAAAIRNLRGALEPKEGTPAYCENIRAIEKSLGLLARSLGSLRLLAHMMSGRTELNESLCDLKRLLEDTSFKLRPIADLSRVALRTVLPERNVQVNADQARMSYGILMLAANAISHAPHGSSVVLSLLDNVEGGIDIRLEDEGRGIPPARLAALRNCLAQPADLIEHAEFGFGIPIASAIARLHGGSLELESHPGRGTRATIRLPDVRTRRRLPSERRSESAVRAH